MGLFLLLTKDVQLGLPPKGISTSATYDLKGSKIFTFRVFFLLSTLASYISMLITVNILASLFAHSRLELILDSGICEQIEKRPLFKEDHTWCTKKVTVRMLLEPRCLHRLNH